MTQFTVEEVHDLIARGWNVGSSITSRANFMQWLHTKETYKLGIENGSIKPRCQTSVDVDSLVD